MSDTYKKIKSKKKSHKPNPLGACRCLHCKHQKASSRSKNAVIDNMKKHNRRVLKQGQDEKIKKGYYYA